MLKFSNRELPTRRSLPSILVLAISLQVVSALTTPAFGQAKPKTLTVGSAAPELEIAKWLTDNNGAFPQVTIFEKDHVYVIDFWATWNRASRASIKQLALVQEQFKDEKVQVISISDEDEEAIRTFLNSKIPNDPAGRSYLEATQAYCLASDPDKSVKKTYFHAAKQTGMPCAFIVGKSGLIEWIGHPNHPEKKIEYVIRKVIDGNWDRDEFIGEQNSDREVRRREVIVRRKVADAMREVDNKMRAGQGREAIDLLDKSLADPDLESVRQPLERRRVETLIRFQFEGIAPALTDFTKKYPYEANELNEFSWRIYEQYASKRTIPDEVMAAAKEAAEVAAKASPSSPNILDTLAHLIFVLDDDIDRAIELQKKAVQLSGVQRSSLVPFLKLLEEEKKRGAFVPFLNELEEEKKRQSKK